MNHIPVKQFPPHTSATVPGAIVERDTNTQELMGVGGGCREEGYWVSGWSFKGAGGFGTRGDGPGGRTSHLQTQWPGEQRKSHLHLGGSQGKPPPLGTSRQEKEGAAGAGNTARKCCFTGNDKEHDVWRDVRAAYSGMQLKHGASHLLGPFPGPGRDPSLLEWCACFCELRKGRQRIWVSPKLRQMELPSH